jgi:hypothetical protein
MSEEEVIEKLKKMYADPAYITNSAYAANTDLWPDHRVPFVEAHLRYLKLHPKLEPEHYLSNLRLMLRKR